MKLRTSVVIIALTMVLVAGFAAGRVASPVRARAQEPKPSPTPVNQHWRVFHGDIETLEPELHDLNREDVEVGIDQLKISDDGKRFVLAISDPPKDEESDEGR